jgi:hypothetical protein
MRRLILPFAAALSCCLILAAQAQSPKPKPTATAAHSPKPTPTVSAKATSNATPQPRPQFRPSVLATGASSLVNRIHVDDLLKKGQKDGAVQFAALVNTDGSIDDWVTYHALKESEALENEVGAQLEEAKFTPPIYEHQPVKALVTGTVLFDADSVPHLRILLNQDPREIEAGSDFIAPQPVIGADSKFIGLHPPEALPVKINGIVNLVAQVTVKGEMAGAQITAEEPPLLGLAEAAAADLEGAKFIPAFRDGDPVDSATIMAFCYKPPADEEEGGSELSLQQSPPPQPPE